MKKISKTRYFLFVAISSGIYAVFVTLLMNTVWPYLLWMGATSMACLAVAFVQTVFYGKPCSDDIVLVAIMFFFGTAVLNALQYNGYLSKGEVSIILAINLGILMGSQIMEDPKVNAVKRIHHNEEKKIAN